LADRKIGEAEEGSQGERFVSSPRRTGRHMLLARAHCQNQRSATFFKCR